nr:MAG TPA: hypothetical protein [Bacteriophage sp.]
MLTVAGVNTTSITAASTITSAGFSHSGVINNADIKNPE